MGKMGILHSCVLNVMPNVQLVALCEKSAIVRRLLKKAFKGVLVLDDITEVPTLDLDAVFVTTPIPSHYSVVKTVYEKKIARNLFVEKTLASASHEARDLCQLAGTFGGVNMVGYLRRFYVTFKKAKELLSDDIIGEASSFRAYAYSSDFYGVDSDVASSRGGVLKDLGCHAIDLASWLFGDLNVARVSSDDAFSSKDRWPNNPVNFKVQSYSGLLGEISVSWQIQGFRMPEVGFIINGSKGKITVNDDRIELDLKSGHKSTLYRHDLSDNVPFWLAMPEYYREDHYFIESIVDRKTAEPDFLSAAKVDEIIDQVEKASGEDRNEK